jgi:hypothetical protein
MRSPAPAIRSFAPSSAFAGDEVRIVTPRGEFRYKVTRTRIVVQAVRVG